MRLYQTGLGIVAGDALLSLAGISVTDVDGDLASTQLSVNHGTLTVALAGASSITAGANASHSLTLSGSEADVNATLASLLYQAEPDYIGADTLTIVSTDNAGASDTNTVAIAVKAINEAPFIGGDLTVAVDAAGTVSLTPPTSPALTQITAPRS